MNPKILSNTELLARVKQLADGERAATAALIAHLAELDERRLYLAEGCSSLFTYCTQILHLSEHAAYARIEAARVVRRFPIMLERLEDGSVNLTTVSLLAAHLTAESHQELLDMVRHRSKRQVEELVARLRPQPPVPTTVRRLPTARPALTPVDLATATRSGPSSATLSPDPPPPVRMRLRSGPTVVSPLAPQRFKVQFTASAETVEKLRGAQALLRHQIPDGDPATIFDLALTALLESLAKKKLAATERPGRGLRPPPGSRHIPAAVKRAVWLRDAGRVMPFAVGGESTADNIQLRCRTHNGYEAELHFGPRHQERVGRNGPPP